MYAAIGAAADIELATFQTYLEMRPEDSNLYINFDGGASEAELELIATGAINNIAMFFDQCYVWASVATNGVSVDEVKGVTKSCKELQIIRDLYNKDKHPHQGPSQSGLSPVLGEVSVRLSFTDSLEMTAFQSTVTFGGNIDRIVSTTIRNSKTNATVGELHDILVKGISAWETFLTAKGLMPTTDTERATIKSREKRSLVFSAPPKEPLPPELPLEAIHYLLAVNTICSYSQTFCLTALHLYAVDRRRDVISRLRLIGERFVEFRDPTDDIGRIALLEAVMAAKPLSESAGTRIGIFSNAGYEPGIWSRTKPIWGDILLPAGYTFVSIPTGETAANTLSAIDHECTQLAFCMFNSVVNRPEEPPVSRWAIEKLPYRYARDWFRNPEVAAGGGYFPIGNPAQSG
jgi:hypothetical protein